jgi:guanylate kinase
LTAKSKRRIEKLENMEKGNITGKSIIFSAPSGAGKTTIVKHLLTKFPSLAFSVSACSREPRPGETNGKDYHFLGVEGFKDKINENAFLEWEEVYTNNYYGTLFSVVEDMWQEGKVVLFDVDVLGGINIKSKLGQKALSVFVQAPSIEELEKRLRGRSTETEDKIQMRMARAEEELAMAHRFDVILENDILEDACLRAEKLIADFLNQ